MIKHNLANKKSQIPPLRTCVVDRYSYYVLLYLDESENKNRFKFVKRKMI